MKLKMIIVFFALSASLWSQYDSLTIKIEEILSELPSGTDYTIFVINPLTIDTLYQYNIDEPLIPASNTKLYTTAVALYLMGPDYKVSTKLFSDDTLLADGIVNGSLYIKGYGNPYFYDEQLQNMVDKLHEIGITKVTGNIFGDDSFFDDIYLREDWIIDDKTDYELPPVSALTLNKNRIEVQKKYYRRGRARYRTVHESITNPPLHIANELRNALVESGIEVNGAAGVDITPDFAAELHEEFVTMRELITRVNKRSDNYAAECLFKLVGAYATGEQGTNINAAQSIIDFLKDNDIYHEGTQVIDGSGLSRYNLTPSAGLVTLLEFIYVDLDYFPLYYEALSIAGVDGTLHDRMENSSAEYNFRGKTGTLRGCSAVSGYLRSKNDDDLIVSIIFLFNKKRTDFYRGIQDRIIELLSTYDYGFEPDFPDY
jgi:D-alanyl-D-alanine carboxypeptidase